MTKPSRSSERGALGPKDPSGPNGDGFGQITLWRQTRLICETCGRTHSRLLVFHPEAQMAHRCQCGADLR